MLADHNAPLKLADGTLIHKDGRVVKPGDTSIPMVEIPTNVEAKALVVRTRRQLADLPAIPQAMTAINVVLVYELFGLSPDEIAIATGLPLQQVIGLRDSDAYASMKGHIVETVLKAESENVRELFQQKAKMAADQISNLMQHGKQETRLAAAKDILDRAGHRPADVHDHRISLNGELKITYTEVSSAPIIDMSLTRN